MHSGSHLNTAPLYLCYIIEMQAKGSRSEPEDGRRPSSGELLLKPIKLCLEDTKYCIFVVSQTTRFRQIFISDWLQFLFLGGKNVKECFSLGRKGKSYKVHNGLMFEFAQPNVLINMLL